MLTNSSRAAALLVLTLVVGAGAVTGATAGRPIPSDASDLSRIDDALAFLAGKSDPRNGTWGTSVRNLLEAIAATPLHPAAWPAEDYGVLESVRPQTPDDPLDPAQRDRAYKANQRAAYAIATAGYDPRDQGGVNFVGLVEAGWDGLQWGDVRFSNDDAWAILALRAAGLPASDARLQAAARNVAADQRESGGFAYGPTSGTDLDYTGMAVAALAKADALTPAIAGPARQFVRSLQDPSSGGFASGSFVGVNCQSTVWAIHGLAVLADAEPIQPAKAFIRSLQQPDGGFINTPGAARSDGWCTAEAIPILAGRLQPWSGFHAGDFDVAASVPVGTTTPLVVASPFTDAVWSAAGAGLVGMPADFTPTSPGIVQVRVVAYGPDTIWRGQTNITVTNAPPSIWVPSEPLLANRSAAFTFQPQVRDPENQPTRLEWGLGEAPAETGPLSIRFEDLGSQTVNLRATDPHGLAAAASIQVDVQNLPPQILAASASRMDNGSAHLVAHAIDPDGPAPTISWTSGEGTWNGSQAWAVLPPGANGLRIAATDMDGGATSRSVTVVTNTTASNDDGAGQLAPASEPSAGQPASAAETAQDSATPPGEESADPQPDQSREGQANQPAEPGAALTGNPSRGAPAPGAMLGGLLVLALAQWRRPRLPGRV